MLKVDHLYHHPDVFQLESGGQLPGFQLKYTTLGQLNKDGSNVVWVCHALTGSSDFTSWWPDLFTEDSPFNPRDHFIICANAIGSCYGSTGPLSIHPETGEPFYHRFPLITNRDVVNAFDLLRQELKINRIHTAIGGSLGGQQVLEWAIAQPEVFENIVPIACTATLSPWVIAFNETQRMAIAADPTWKENDERAGREGMKVARAIAMISFRTYETYSHTQAEKNGEKLDDYRASSYQRYQGEKLANRFNAYSYWTLSKMMDNHHVGRGRGSAQEALQQIQAKALVIGIDSDVLFPLADQRFIAENIPGSKLKEISSIYGHDGFLVESAILKKTVRDFYRQEEELELKK
jgi:homoserine O-acetyltransferase